MEDMIFFVMTEKTNSIFWITNSFEEAQNIIDDQSAVDDTKYCIRSISRETLANVLNKVKETWA